MAKKMRETITSYILPILLLLLAVQTNAHNVTRLLSHHPSFSSFNHLLTKTYLADEINRRTTITVCAVNNSAMSALTSKGYTISTLKHILSLHVLLDYFDAKKLQQIGGGSALAATLFQATGDAPETTGFVNITILRDGTVGLRPDGGNLSSFFVKSIEEVPYNISIIQINRILPSDTASAPTRDPEEMNITGIMLARGCKVFAETLLSSHRASITYQESVQGLGGMTVFCPGDDAMERFLPKYKKLTAPKKEAFLQFLAVPTYYSMTMLKTNNGPMNTLATYGANKFQLTVQNDGDKVNLKTRINIVQIVDTLIDEQPLSIYRTDEVLLPKELFKASAVEASPPAPEDGDVADCQKPSKGKANGKKKKAAPSPDDSLGESDSPAEGPDGEADDVTADEASGAVRIVGGAKAGLVLVVSLLNLFASFWLL
ncbi:unnamed protein product [Eruca vesicaria subsp. sativa]|uniref:FAS1 domain-containing protein n=1 Tax=Eruca vesicaria subsp. sativa TaxID=29727 RepID=A0ABC8J4Q1_ERUVS|nr:unnamed protein product [Eruca vesicaria subsp. sativa]